ncbi:MAG: DUF4276 family protein, partial [Candidatus Muiribacteriota bacterium]
MNNYINVIAIVEGKTEQNFIEKILAPYLGFKNIGIRATQVSKPGQKGGDVRFSRVKKDLIIHLKQQTDTYITTFVDYYGIKEWPGLNLIKENDNPESISIKLNEGAKAEIESVFSKKVIEKRFIPFVAIHEFEALLFSHPAILSESIGIKEITVKEVIDEFGSPEAINNSP